MRYAALRSGEERKLTRTPSLVSSLRRRRKKRFEIAWKRPSHSSIQKSRRRSELHQADSAEDGSSRFRIEKQPKPADPGIAARNAMTRWAYRCGASSTAPADKKLINTAIRARRAIVIGRHQPVEVDPNLKGTRNRTSAASSLLYFICLRSLCSLASARSARGVGMSSAGRRTAPYIPAAIAAPMSGAIMNNHSC